MKPLPIALDLVRSRCRPLGSEEVAVAKAAGRILSHPVSAARDLPGTDISMMDGYALRATDSGETLRVVYEVAAGDPPPARELGGREAARIFTGAPVPPGADCVVMQEQAERRGDELRVPRAAAGQHIRRRGEEVHAGDVVLPSGTTLHAAELSLAAASGSARVRVYRLPRVGILVTGNELVPVGSDPPPGKLIETNSIAIAQYVREAGAEPVLLGIAKDSTDEIARLLGSAHADVLVTTGGASVGDHDHAQAAFEKLAGELVFHTVAIRPGKPVLFG
ncbi:MAG: molybdopterin molybdotransferase MoeA, partial [Myxococcales bacterium]